MSTQMLFECVGGFFVPCLPTNADGSPREVDGVRRFHAADVAARCCIDESCVTEAAGIFFGEVMTASAPSVVAAHAALREKYAHLSDSQFELFLQQCKRLRFSPFGKHLCAYPKRNDRTGADELIIELTADGFHATALRTGELLRLVGPEWRGETGEWSDVWTQDKPPMAARVGVLRKGMTEPLFMVAHWRDYAPYRFGPSGKKVFDEFWLKMAAFMLGKCAACLALRRAFAEHLDGVYGPEEMQQAKNPRAQADAEARAEQTYVPDVVPETSQQFRMELINLGLGNGPKREAVIEEFRERFRPLYTQNIRGWYKAVLAEVRRDPVMYGAVVECAEA